MPVLRAKVSVLGDSKCGKSSLCNSILRGPLSNKTYMMTLGCDLNVKSVKIPDSEYQVDLYLMDTSGHEVYDEVRPKFIADSNYYIVCYDVTDKQSFKDLPKWINMAKAEVDKKDHALREGRVIVCACKADLREFSVILKDDAMAVANEHECGYFECSALTAQDVDAPFNFIATQSFNHYKGCVEALMDM
jgi:small GTP-binding protein